MENYKHEPWYNPKIKHGAAHRGHVTLLYRVWGNLKERCLNTEGRDYKRYGAKGIGFPRQWLEFTAFRTWCHANGYKKGLVMNRRDKDRGFYPNNIEFITRQEASIKRNATKRKFTWAQVQTIRASKTPVNQLAREYGVVAHTIQKIRDFRTYKKEKTANV